MMQSASYHLSLRGDGPCRHCFNLVDIGGGPSSAASLPVGFCARFRPCRGPSGTRSRGSRLGPCPRVRRARGLSRPNQPPAGWAGRAPWGSPGCAPVRAGVPRGARQLPHLRPRTHAVLHHGLPERRQDGPRLTAVVPGPVVAGWAAGPGPGGPGRPRRGPGCAVPRCAACARRTAAGPGPPPRGRAWTGSSSVVSPRTPRAARSVNQPPQSKPGPPGRRSGRSPSGPRTTATGHLTPPMDSRVSSTSTQGGRAA